MGAFGEGDIYRIVGSDGKAVVDTDYFRRKSSLVECDPFICDYPHHSQWLVDCASALQVAHQRVEEALTDLRVMASNRDGADITQEGFFGLAAMMREHGEERSFERMMLLGMDSPRVGQEPQGCARVEGLLQEHLLLLASRGEMTRAAELKEKVRRKPSPVLEITATWKEPRSDVDLDVREPSGAWCSRLQFSEGCVGAVSSDERVGPGKEEYILRKHERGVFVVHLTLARYQHPTPVTVVIRSNAGSPAEKREEIPVLLDGRNRVYVKEVRVE